MKKSNLFVIKFFILIGLILGLSACGLSSIPNPADNTGKPRGATFTYPKDASNKEDLRVRTKILDAKAISEIKNYSPEELAKDGLTDAVPSRASEITYFNLPLTDGTTVAGCVGFKSIKHGEPGITIAPGNRVFECNFFHDDVIYLIVTMSSDSENYSNTHMKEILDSWKWDKETPKIPVT